MKQAGDGVMAELKIRISAEDIAEKALNEYTYKGKTIRQWADIIKKYDEHRWIPCSEKLPDNNKDVLCYATSLARGGDVMFTGSYNRGYWFLQSSIGNYSFPTQYKIVAWMPLPEPYKEGEA